MLNACLICSFQVKPRRIRSERSASQLLEQPSMLQQSEDCVEENQAQLQGDHVEAAAAIELLENAAEVNIINLQN